MIKIYEIECGHYIDFSALSKDSVIVDAGACEGVFITDLFRRCPWNTWTFYAIEPSKFNLNLLRTNYGNTIDIEPAALVANSKYAQNAKYNEFYSKEWGGVENLNYQAARIRTSYDVPTVTLGSVLKKYPDIAYLKMDIEGSESSIILELTSETAQHIQQISVEVHNKDVDVLQAHLASIGYNTMVLPNYELYATLKGGTIAAITSSEYEYIENTSEYKSKQWYNASDIDVHDKAYIIEYAEAALNNILSGFNAKNVLDVGSGNGRLSPILGPLCEQLLCIDQNRYPNSNLTTANTSFNMASFQKFDTDVTFDVIVFWGVFYNLDTPSYLENLTKAVKLLSTGGKIIILDNKNRMHKYDTTSQHYDLLDLANKLDLVVENCPYTDTNGNELIYSVKVLTRATNAKSE